jgi:hypothetical protein
MQVGDDVRPVGTIIGVDFEAFDDVYGSTFKAASGRNFPHSADTDIVVGARIPDPRLMEPHC